MKTKYRICPEKNSTAYYISYKNGTNVNGIY